MDGLVKNSITSVFQGKRVIVTGDTGFKGSWLSLWLHELGAEVVGFALPPERAKDQFNLLGLTNLIRHVDGDIRDLAALQRVFSEFQPEFLFHLAAQALVRRSYEEPKLTFDTNVSGSVNILEVSRAARSLRSIIYVTSDKCYRNREWVWGYRENDELGGRDPYSASKAAAEMVFAAYADSYLKDRECLGAASVRAGNVIGGGDWAVDRIVPDSMTALQNGQPIVLRNPSSTRPWQHVLEPLSGYLMLAARMYDQPKTFSGSWNFGPGCEAVRTVGDLAHKIVACWGAGTVQSVAENNAPHEAGLLQLNCDKAQQVLGWRPGWGFDRAVEETVHWYKSIAAGQPALAVTKKQIRDYMEA